MVPKKKAQKLIEFLKEMEGKSLAMGLAGRMRWQGGMAGR